MRGTRTQGYGTVGQHRKAGQRAGKGKTTQWKKSKKTYYLKQKELGFPDPDWDLGKRGFKRPGRWAECLPCGWKRFSLSCAARLVISGRGACGGRLGFRWPLR